MVVKSVFVSARSAVMVMGCAMALGAAPGCGKKEPAAPPAPAAAASGSAEDPSQGRRIDLTDNAEVERVALESLKAYREKNIEKLAELGPPNAKEKLIFLEPRNPNYNTLLGDDTWRMKSLRAWAGDKLSKISRGIDDVALGWYHEDETHEYAVEVRKNDGRWTFFDLVQREKSGAVAPPPGAQPTP